MDVVALAKARSLIESGTGRVVRRSAGLSLAEVGKAIGVDKSTVHRWETGERRPSGRFALAYADLLRQLMATGR